MKYMKIVIMQVIILMVIVGGILMFYPRADIGLEGNLVSFDSINANVIEISDNPEFNNSRFLDLREENVSFRLVPGTYYWRAYNGVLEGMVHEFVISENETENIVTKDAMLKVEKDEKGGFTGKIVLEDEE
jgi:hypothetical protein